jgi:dihydrofolate reductase
MAKISLIAAIDEAGGLGLNNQLLCHLPADLKHFKTITLGKPIIMGRKTFLSIGKPLPGRKNIVLSHAMPAQEGVEVVHTIPEAIALAEAEEVDEIMIIGGAKLFQETLALASTIYLTRIHHRFEADVFFPALFATEWRCEEAIHRTKDDKNLYDMTFEKYIRKI